MTGLENEKYCDKCGRLMIFDGLNAKHGPEYSCPNNCVIEEAISKEEEYTQEEAEDFLNRDPPKPYQNHCWNCQESISSEFCQPDPGFGYKCRRCGKSLREWKELQEPGMLRS